jgi:hypothetical protein
VTDEVTWRRHGQRARRVSRGWRRGRRVDRGAVEDWRWSEVVTGSRRINRECR